MNKIKRSFAIQILNSGYSAINIFERLSLLFEVPKEDIERIIKTYNWDKKLILNTFNMFANSHKKPERYLKVYSPFKEVV